ncbi:MAG: hypothetical protein ABIU63_03625 [Chitinophagaceae bacterium]
MKKKATDESTDKKKVYGDPVYGPNEDIYAQGEKTSISEELDGDPTTLQEGRGDDLDIPGTELDDEAEKTGGEDEENNYYSIGGDNHDDLEEHKEEDDR